MGLASSGGAFASDIGAAKTGVNVDFYRLAVRAGDGSAEWRPAPAAPIADEDEVRCECNGVALSAGAAGELPDARALGVAGVAGADVLVDGASVVFVALEAV